MENVGTLSSLVIFIVSSVIGDGGENERGTKDDVLLHVIKHFHTVHVPCIYVFPFCMCYTSTLSQCCPLSHCALSFSFLKKSRTCSSTH